MLRPPLFGGLVVHGKPEPSDAPTLALERREIAVKRDCDVMIAIFLGVERATFPETPHLRLERSVLIFEMFELGLGLVFALVRAAALDRLNILALKLRRDRAVDEFR